jgi:hypothetical protein
LRGSKQRLRPRRHERKAITLGGTEFDAIEMFDCESVFVKYIAAVGDVFWRLRLRRLGLRTPHRRHRTHRVSHNTLVEGVVVRRPATLPPGALQEWMRRKDAERRAAKP